MDANELGRWTRFAAKGGIGKCTALQDCVAEQPEDLMFLKDDEIIVLMHLPGQDDMYLGYCEGVVGRFHGASVQFHTRLKKPIIIKRSSSVAQTPISRPSSSQSALTVVARDPTPAPSSPRPPPPAQHSRSISGSTSYDQSTLDSHTQVSSLSLPASPLPPFQGYDDSLHMRSVSHSSTSTALESAPRTPADFSREDVQDGIRIVSSSGLRHGDSNITLHEADDHEINAPGDVHQPEKMTKSFEPAHQHFHDPEAIEDRSNTMYSGSDASTRISVALSDGEVGIGLSLLQDFANGDIEDDDAASVASSNRMRTSDTDPVAVEDVPGSPDSTIEGHSAPSVRSFAPSFTPSIQSVAPSESNYSTSPVSTYQSLPAPRVPSRGSTHPSVTDSFEFGEEWEGASDIYDNYRYSRFSMASKMSRGSRASVHTVASFDVPPVPVDMRRPSMDNTSERAEKERAVESAMMAVRPSNEAIHIPSPLNPVTQEAKSLESKHIPPPLVLSHNSHMTKASISSSGIANDSPLLHTSFGSPSSVSTPQLTSHFSSQEVFSSSAMPSVGGVASPLREKLELEKDSDPGINSRAESKPDMIRRISTTNDTIINNHAQESSYKSAPSVSESEHGLSRSETLPQQSFASSVTQAKTSNASSSYPSEKKQPPALVVVNPAPPPYTSDSPTISSSSQLLPNLAPPQVNPTSQQPIPRPQNLDRPPGSPVSRTSLFLPHPNAPKPTPTSIGPMYGRRPLSPSLPIGYPGSAVQALHMALAARPRLVTIYGRCEWDLSMSMGPVPVIFGLEHPNNIPANRMGVPGRPSVNYPSGGRGGPSSTLPPQQPSVQTFEGQSPSAAAVSASPGQEADNASKVIPRANFFPQAQTTRPRSRSFSGFSSPIAEIELPVEKSLKEGGQSRQPSPTPASTKRSKSTSSTNTIASSRDITTPSMPASRSTYAPSPLSLSQNNIIITPRSTPTSPSHTTLPSPLSVTKPTLPQLSIDNLPAKSLATEKTESPFLPSVSEVSPVKSVNVHAKTDSTVSSPIAQSSNSPSRSTRVLRHSRSSVLSTSRQEPHLSLRRRRSGDTDISRYSDSRSITSSPPSGSSGAPAVARQGSLRSKLSLSILRTKSSDRTLHQEDTSQTIQVQDMDFEIVQPVGAATVASDEDAASLTMPSPIRLDGPSFLRADSPAISMVSATSSRAPLSERSLRLPLSEMDSPTPALKSLPSGDVEAHRQRELRWVTTIGAIPAAQARKTKKLRKLLLEGVPASVRCLVWAHLTDSKSKRVEGLYARLGKRERVASFNAIESDIRECFSNQPLLQDGSLLSLLQAYLTLVPDIQYDRGLTLIAGQLLMQSPEEDAFWTFISMMDAHVRLYFASNPIQLEVDAALFGKSLENNDPTLAKKLFVDMAIPPVEVCRSWFTTLFVDTLPLEYAHRIWDLFLFEGVTFLFRVGLAIFSSSRRILLRSTSSESVLAFLRHPPTSCLPPDPDAFLELAFSVKLKDEDIRKQRSKMEAQVKRQTQARTLSATGTRTPSISLPRT